MKPSIACDMPAVCVFVWPRMYACVSVWPIQYCILHTYTVYLFCILYLLFCAALELPWTICHPFQYSNQAAQRDRTGITIHCVVIKLFTATMQQNSASSHLGDPYTQRNSITSWSSEILGHVRYLESFLQMLMRLNYLLMLEYLPFLMLHIFIIIKMMVQKKDQ